MNPVNEYLGPFIEASCRALVDAGFLRVVYSTVPGAGGTGQRALVGIPLWGDPELKVVEALPEATGAVSGEAARLGAIGFFRDQRVVEVIFAPIDDGSGDMDYGPGSISVTVEVSFPSGIGARTARSGGNLGTARPHMGQCPTRGIG